MSASSATGAGATGAGAIYGAGGATADRLAAGAVVVALVGTAFGWWPVAHSVAVPAQLWLAPKGFALAVAAVLACASLVVRGPSMARRLAADPLTRVLVLWVAVRSLAAVLAGGEPLVRVSPILLEASAAMVLVATRVWVAESPDAAPAFRRLVIVVGVALALVATGEAIGWVTFDSERRPGSLMGHRNALGAIMAMVAPLALVAPARRRMLPFVAAVLVVTVLVLTRSRAAWLGGGAALVALCVTLRPWEWTRRARALVAAGAVALAIVIATLVPWGGLAWRESSPYLATASRMVEVDRGSGRVRVEQLRIAATVVRERPAGVGPLGWNDAVARFGSGTSVATQPFSGTPVPQSEVSRIATESGALGIFAGLAVIVVVAGGALGLGGRGGRPRDPSAIAALAAAVPPILFDAPLARADTLTMIALLIALAWRHVPIARAPLARSWRRAPAGERLCALALATALVVSVAAVYVAGRRCASIAADSRDPVALIAAFDAFPEPRLVERALFLRRDDRALADRALAAAPDRWGTLVLAAELADRAGDDGERDVLRRRFHELHPDLSLAAARRALGVPHGS